MEKGGGGEVLFDGGGGDEGEGGEGGVVAVKALEGKKRGG